MEKPHLMVVGSTSAIGSCLINRLKDRFKISALGRREQNLSGLDDRCIKSFTFDALSTDSIEQAFTGAVNHFGKVSLFIYCAGVQLIKPIRNLTSEEIDSLIRVNLSCPLIFSSLLASKKYSELDSVLCFISSIAGKKPEPGIALYSASKAAIDSLVSSLAIEMRPRRVVGVAPGWLDTPMTKKYDNIYTPEYIKSLKEKSPLGLATVENVVDAVEFLFSEKAKLITGQVITVDGGASIC